MQDRVAIRTAQKEDAPVLDAMLRSLAADIGVPEGIRGGPEDLARHGFGPEPRFTAWIASLDGMDVGMLLCFPEFSTWRGKPGVYVQDLWVSAEHRGSGVARALLAEAARHCERIGGCYLRLSAASNNLAAANFYERMGFAEKFDERLFVLEGKPLSVLKMIG